MIENKDIKHDLKPDYKRYSNLVKASFIAILVDLGLILFKTLLAEYSGNDVLLADALHSGGDLAVSLIVLLSIIVHHSFHDSTGAKRIEALAAFVISLGLINSSLRMLSNILSDQIYTFSFAGRAEIPIVVTLAGVSLILGITLVMARYKHRVGKENDSIAFKAEGLHTYSDFLTSLGVWITLFIGYFGPQIGRLMSIVIALAVLQIGLKLLLSSLKSIKFPLRLPSRISILFPPGLKEKTRSILQAVKDLVDRINGFLSGVSQIPAKTIVLYRSRMIIANLIVLILLYAGTGFYQVMPYQTGLEMFLGKVVEKNTAGLHYHPPDPLGQVILVDTSIAIRLESGFRTNVYFDGNEPDVYLWEHTHQEGLYLKILSEALAITGDENLVDVNFLCYYRITDPEDYVLKNKNTHEMMRSILVQNARRVISHYQIDPLLAEKRGTVQDELMSRMEAAISGYDFGVQILSVYMQEAHPPIEVIPEYRAVGSAREQKDYLILKAGSYANEVLPKTKGKTVSVVLDAEAQAYAKTAEATGEATRLKLSQGEFGRNPSVHMMRLKWESIEKALKDKTIVVIPKAAKRRQMITNNPKQNSP